MFYVVINDMAHSAATPRKGKMKMPVSLIILMCLILLGACRGAKDTKETLIPQHIATTDSINSVMEKLTPEERDLAFGYIMRQTVGEKGGPGIPHGMTIGKAITEQQKFKDDAAIERAKQQEPKASEATSS